MKRFDQIGGPYPMAETPNGYWITYDSYNQSVLDANKLVEKSRRARDNQASSYTSKLEHLHNIIIVLSVTLFATVASLIFIGLTK